MTKLCAGPTQGQRCQRWPRDWPAMGQSLVFAEDQAANPAVIITIQAAIYLPDELIYPQHLTPGSIDS